MIVKQNLVPKAKYSLKCPHKMDPVGVCVHNTANDASAKNEISYMVSNDNQASFHYAVDDKEVWQGLPLDRNGWHAGDGANGKGNRQHIGIEICYSESGGSRFDVAEDNAAQLIAQILRERGWGIDKVKKHQDFSGKYCPHRTLDKGWDRFLNLIKKYAGPAEEHMSADYHRGLNLNDKESMKIVVDLWDEVMNKKRWIKLDELGELFTLAGAESVPGLLAEFKNRLDQISRLKKQLTEEQKLRIDAVARSEDSKKLVEAYENSIVERQTTINEQARTIGELQVELEELRNSIKQDQDDDISVPVPPSDPIELSWHEHILLAIKKLVRLV